jgi:hypothetical protein
VSNWISVRELGPVEAPAPPWVVATSHVENFRQVAGNRGANVSLIDVADAESTFDVIVRLREVVAVPDWCGNSWDSIHDAFPDVLSANQFPLILLVDGLAHLLSRRPALGLHAVDELSSLSRSLGAAGAQFEPVYLFPML